ncbi:DUF2125 domain-containing protein [Meridianimarinicoccus sp. RP-17]|uniref:DUF2125 domain-containing protein n=1 Tax=Meridianimarinicoccus zhengii TaxID=2056810 RepID=UPI0013A6F377|nr:DUF2125 domain-containing protein [Phycocomes zhengii]
MRILLAVILVAAVAWAGYWFLGAQAVERGLRGWLDARTAEGWVVSVERLETAGFPNRFDTTLTGVELADPATGWAWQAPFFQTLALSYRPNHVIAVWPDSQTLATPLQRMDIGSDRMRGSLVFAGGTAFTLDRATVEMSAVTLESNAGWQAAMADNQLALRRTPAKAGHSYDIAFDATDLALPDGLAARLGQGANVGDVVQRLSMEAQVEFDAPWDRRAIEDRRPQPTRIDLTLARASWGGLDLRLAGTLDVDTAGVPTGSVTIKATNWREMLDMATAAGLVPANLARLLEGGLAQMARMNGNPDTLDVPLRFAEGRVSLGGLLPLGPAPRLVLR